jgi:hypothetical protein
MASLSIHGSSGSCDTPCCSNSIDRRTVGTVGSKTGMDGTHGRGGCDALGSNYIVKRTIGNRRCHNRNGSYRWRRRECHTDGSEITTSVRRTFADVDGIVHQYASSR